MTRFLLLFAAIAGVQSASTASRSIVELQPYAERTSLSTQVGDSTGYARLTNLNPQFNIWYLLEVSWPGQSGLAKFHLENPDPGRFAYTLDQSHMAGLLISEGATMYPCNLWQEYDSELRQASASSKSYVSICDGRILVRNETEGKETTKEFVTDFLRKYVWGGEKITGLVKDYLYQDKFLLTSNANPAPLGAPSGATEPSPDTSPEPALVDARYQGATLEAEELGIAIEGATADSMVVGKWYTSSASPHAFVSVMQPKLVERSLFKTHTGRVKPLDSIEQSAMVYLLAFRLSQLELGYALGTLHPSPEWSYRTPGHMKTEGKPGPDGVGSYTPMIMVGKVNPIKAPRVVAVFAGGFKRTHGAFKWGRLSEVNQASHYGFRVNGITFSTLQPELATLLIHRDGEVRMKTWTDRDNASLPDILHARQNGVPIIDWDNVANRGIPGEYVDQWAQGNWSGSAQSEQRTLRAGACMHQANGETFLIYGYFSSVTPSSMARVFQSYQCRYAMHLDMNALEHTYIALYQRNDKKFDIQHLVTGMNVLDRTEKDTGTIVPRFTGTADNRDFFYVMDKN